MHDTCMKTITDSMLRVAARQTVTENPAVMAVLLYGSRARGKARPGSDWDIAVVTRGPDVGTVQWIDPVAFRDLPGEVNALAITHGTLCARRNDAGHLAADLAREAKALAGRLPDLGPLERRPRMTPENMTGWIDAILLEIRRLARDAADVTYPNTTEKELRGFGRTLPGGSADAAELFAKMAIKRRVGEYEWTHDLQALAKALQATNADGRWNDLVALVHALNGNSRKHHQYSYPNVRITAWDVKLGRTRFRRLLPALLAEIEDAARTPDLKEAAKEGMDEYHRSCHKTLGFFPDVARPLSSGADRMTRAVIRMLPDIRAALAGGLTPEPLAPLNVKAFTRLHAAARDGDVAALDRLMSANADGLSMDLDRTTESGLTPLHLAATFGRIGTIMTLVEAGARTDVRGTRGTTPLHEAAAQGRREVVMALLEAGADATAADVYGFTPLHEAALAGASKCLALLLDAGSDPEARDAELSTPLHEASEAGDAVSVRRLVHAGTSVRVVDLDGWTPLHRAAQSGSQKAVRVLLEAGAETGLTDDAGWTPLHQAAASGNVRTIRILLDAGADPSVPTRHGVNACDLAEEIGGISDGDLLKRLDTAG